MLRNGALSNKRLLITGLLIPGLMLAYMSLPVVYKSHIYKYYSQVKLRSYNKFAMRVLKTPLPLSYVNQKKLQDKLNFPAAWAVNKIEEDFSTYTDISKDNVQKTFNTFPAHKALIKFAIKDGKVAVTQKDELNKAQQRGLEIYTNIFQYIAKHGYVKDVSFLLRLSDHFYDLPAEFDFNFAPIFATNKNSINAMDRRLVLIPDYMSLEDIPKFAPRILYANKLYPWQQKLDQVLWRGGYADVTGYRQKVVEYAQAHPESMINAKYAEDKNAPEFMLPEDQVRAKYLLNIDGHCPAWTRPIWQLLSNSVMIKHESIFTQWYYQAIQPGAHYILVSQDPKDLESTIIKYTDQELQTIAMNGHEFARNNLLIDDMIAYIIMAVQKYEQLQAAADGK